MRSRTSMPRSSPSDIGCMVCVPQARSLLINPASMSSTRPIPLGMDSDDARTWMDIVSSVWYLDERSDALVCVLDIPAFRLPETGPHPPCAWVDADFTL